MFNLTKPLSGTLVSSVLTTGLTGVIPLNTPPASAQVVIGGGGTCTPHLVTYEQYVPGHYDQQGVWIPSKYVPRFRMSTECNPFNPPVNVNLSGSWCTDANFVGAATSIRQTGFDTYQLTNEQGSSSNAYLSGNQIVAPQWGVTGNLQNNQNRIAWSNGTNWSRSSGQTGFNPGINLPSDMSCQLQG